MLTHYLRNLHESGPVFWPFSLLHQSRQSVFQLIKYACKPGCLTILTQQEWLLIFSQTILSYGYSNREINNDIQLIVNILEHEGIQTEMKFYAGEYYLVIYSYPEWLDHLFRIYSAHLDIPQRLRMGIGALGADWNSPTSVHVIALTDVILTDAVVPHLHYILNDEHMFVSAGVERATLMVETISTVSTLFISDECFPVSKAVSLGLMFSSVILPANMSVEIKRLFTAEMLAFVYGMSRYSLKENFCESGA